MSDPNQDPTQPFGAPATPPVPPPAAPPAGPPPAAPPPGPPSQPPGYPPQPPGYPPPAAPPGPPATAPGFAPGAGAPPPGYYGQPGGAPPPGYQPAAQPYQYGAGVPSGINLATPGKRILGRIIDWIILTVIMVPIWIIVIATMGTTTTTSSEFGGTTGVSTSFGTGGILLLTLFLFAVQVIYEVAFIALKGQTPGAMAVKVKVVRLADGQIPGWGPAFLRWLPNLVGILCSLLSLGLWIWALVNLFNNPLRQTPFDLAAKTVVIDVA